MNNKRAVWITVGLVICWGAQATDITPLPNPSAQQYQRIREQRALQEATFLKAQQACADRFAVSDCLTQVRRERRAAMDELRRQEIVLNDLERQSKAIAELKRLENNRSIEHQQAQELQHQQALQSTQARQTRNDEKKAAVAKATEFRVSVTKPSEPENHPDVTLNQQRYTEKLMEAEKRKTDKTSSLKEKASAKPLPMPAGL